MARKEGTGGRGGPGQIQDINLDSFEVVEEAEEIVRSNTPPSKYAPLIEKARQHPGRKLEDRVPVQATDDQGNPMVDEAGNPVWKREPVPVLNEDGTPAVDGDGTPVMEYETGRIVTEPRTYKLAEAREFYDGLRNAGNRAKLTAKRLSLRIPTQPSNLSKATDESQEFRIQFYIIPLSSGQQQEAPAS